MAYKRHAQTHSNQRTLNKNRNNDDSCDIAPYFWKRLVGRGEYKDQTGWGVSTRTRLVGGEHKDHTGWGCEYKNQTGWRVNTRTRLVSGVSTRTRLVVVAEPDGNELKVCHSPQ